MMKRGEVSSSFLIQVLLGIMGSAAIILLGFQLISPYYDSEGKGADAYLDSLKDGVYSATQGKVGSFQIVDNGKEDLDYYLVYFGSKLNIDEEISDSIFAEDVSFSYSGVEAKNSICVCYGDEDFVLCDSCYSLDLPARVRVVGEKSLVVDGGDFWIGKEGVSFQINKDGDGYVFSEK